MFKEKTIRYRATLKFIRKVYGNFAATADFPSKPTFDERSAYKKIIAIFKCRLFESNMSIEKFLLFRPERLRL